MKVEESQIITITLIDLEYHMILFKKKLQSIEI